MCCRHQIPVAGISDLCLPLFLRSGNSCWLEHQPLYVGRMMAAEPSLGTPMASLPMVGVKLYPSLCLMKENLALEHPEHCLLWGVHLLATGVLGWPIPDVEVLVAVLGCGGCTQRKRQSWWFGFHSQLKHGGTPKTAVLQAEGRDGATGHPHSAVLPITAGTRLPSGVLMARGWVCIALPSSSRKLSCSILASSVIT